MHLIDHTDTLWESQYKSRGRENGAATYSRELVKFQVPVWAEELAGQKLTISTCPLLRNRPLPGGDVLVQYLHEWRYRNPAGQATQVHANARHLYREVVFVAAYAGLCADLRAAGLTALFLPMSIDTEPLRAVQPPAIRLDRVIAYFGNVTMPKREQYATVRKTVPSAELLFHHPKSRQPAVWNELAKYRYGIGVGRCALEMAALGLRVLISGAAYGGLVMNEEDYAIQQSTNFNGRKVTGAPTLREGLQLLPSSAQWNPLDSRDAAELLRNQIREKFDGRGLPLS